MDDINNGKTGNINPKDKTRTPSSKYEDVEMELGDDDMEYNEVGIWKNPYAVAIIVIAIWFSLWLFLQVFMGRWFS
jgi:hypothetical protein